MENKNAFMTQIRYFAFLILCGGITVLLYLAAVGNTDQVYQDVIVSNYVSKTSDNKSIEMYLLYFLIFAGIMCCALFYFRQQKKRTDSAHTIAANRTASGYQNYFAMAVPVVAGVRYCAYSGANLMMILSMLYVVLLLLTDKKQIFPGMVFLYLTAYGIAAIYRVYAWLGGMQEQNEDFVPILALLISVLFLMFRQRDTAFRRGALLIQLVIPMLLLIFTKSVYLYQGEFHTLQIPKAVHIFVVILIIACMSEGIGTLKKQWNHTGNFGQVISLSSCFCIMAFHRFSGSGAVMSSDIHHPFENVIGYTQIFQQGQKAFEQYIPVSGLYSVVHGAVFQMFGNGLYANYFLTQNIFFTLVLLLTVWLLNKQLNRELIFLVALFLGTNDYNRTIWILPVMLLLSMPALLRRKNLWLKVWMFTSFLHGLYYPVNGAAVCAAFLPYGIGQIVTYIRSGEFKTDRKKFSFWAGWGVCIIPIACGYPLLAGTYRHIKAMADQSVTQSGITCFAQMPADHFFPFLSEYTMLRVVLYVILTFLIPAVTAWAAFLMTMHIAGAGKNRMEGCLGISLVIMPAVAYSYTFVRLDHFLSRSQAGLAAVAVMLLVFSIRYLQDERLKISFFCFAFFIFGMLEMNGITGDSWKLSAYETVPDGYVYIENEEDRRIGTGFMETDLYENIAAGWERVKDLDRENSYLGVCDFFGHYYFYSLKGISVMETATITGFGAAQETVDLLKEQKSVVSGISPFANYYLYRWLTLSGRYYWDHKKEMYVPYDHPDNRETTVYNREMRILDKDLEAGKTPASWGASFASLCRIFSVPQTEVQVIQKEKMAELLFSETTDGGSADFLYLEFDNMQQDIRYVLSEKEQALSGWMSFGRYLMKKTYHPGKKIVLTWQDAYGESCSIRCDLSRGKLLIPLGAGKNWLLNDHDKISVSAEMDGTVIATPEITSARLLKLREVQ